MKSSKTKDKDLVVVIVYECVLWYICVCARTCVSPSLSERPLSWCSREA